MFKKTIAMPFALAAAIVGVSALTADTAHAQRFRYGVNGRTAVRVVTPGNRVISTSPVYSTNGRVYYNNGYSTQGYNQTYRSYRPAYPGTYYNARLITVAQEPTTPRLDILTRRITRTTTAMATRRPITAPRVSK